ncbi:Hsp20/alpha crystallin family protein [Candidatus Nomurabacteria bacterium]|nr:Hsp20/alpha crystallin family protein [Candidatus Nomurabacteria bacterium]
MEPRKRSFFERLTGSVNMEEEQEEVRRDSPKGGKKAEWLEEENEGAELAVDVYQTPTDIVVQTMVAGVKPEDLDLTIARDLVTIGGKREDSRNVNEENYFAKELYWGKFSRTISLPQEVEPEEVDAVERHGLLTIRLKKVDKEKKNTIKVKSI